MALPTITNNSPAAGSIAWTQFGIQYNGQSFIIPAGNTAQKYVWWLYGGGTAPALQSGNAMPELGPDDMILFLNKAGIGVLVPTAELLDGSLIVGGSILAAAIGANEIQTSHLSANAVTANEIASNAIMTQHLSAGTITADKLSVGTVSDNMVVNGSFEDALSGTLVGWEVNAMTNGTIQAVTGQSSSGAVSIQFAATTTTANLRLRQLPAQYIPVSAASGRKYYISTRAGASTATASGHYMRVNWYDANKNLISSSDVRSNGALTTTFTLYEGQATPPATAKYMGMEILITNINVVTTAYVDEVSAHEVTMSAQIGDGQITAAKITANTITADRIQTAAITADKLLVSDRTNYWENPDFEIDTVGQQPKGIGSNTLCRVISGGARGSGKALEVDARNGANNDVFSTNVFPVTPGDQFYIAYDYKFLNTAGAGNAGVGFRTYGPTKVGITWTIVASTGSARPTTWQEADNGKEGIYTVPAGTYFLQPWVTFANNSETTNRFHSDNIIIRRLSGGELIVDGAIIAAKIATDAVSSDKIIANAITAVKINADAVVAGKIAANAITAREIQANVIVSNLIASDQILGNHIYAGAITADKIDANAINGKTITGATIQTAETGARVVMDSSGLGAWDAATKKYLTADANGITIDGTIATTGGTNWLGEEVVVKISDTASTSGGRNIAGLSFEREGLTPIAFPAVYSDAGTDLMLTAVNNQAFLSLANENSGGEAELQGQGINLYSNTGDVKIGKTYNTPGNLQVAKINGKRPPIGLLSLQRLTGVTTVTTTDSQISAVTVSVTPGMVLEVSGSYAGGPSGASGQYLSWGWKANGVRFAENSHRSNTNGYGEGDSFSGFYTVPAGQTSVTISLWGLVAAGGGTYVCPADSNSPKLQYAIKDIGDV